MTTIVGVSQSVTGIVPVGSQITVTTAAGSSAVVRRIYDGVTVQTVTVGASDSQAFGPYLVEMSLQISCVTGSCEFSDARVTDAVTGGGGGGGASSFTALEDAPATITPLALVVGDPDGNAVEMPDWVSVDSEYHGIEVRAANPDTDGNGSYLLVAQTPTVKVQMSVTEGESYLILDAGAATSALIGTRESANEFLIQKSAGSAFTLQGFDVAASDATATMTVNAVEYDIAKAVPVKVGSSTYFLPLFGPVA